MIGTADYISQGIVDRKEVESLYDGADEIVERIVRDSANVKKEKMKNRLEEGVSRYLHVETGKRPFVRVIVNFININ